MNRRAFLSASALSLVLLPLGLDRAKVATPDPNVRTVEVLQDRSWVPIPWADLKRGMIFRLREPDGALVDEGEPHEVSLAMADASLSPWRGRKGAHGLPDQEGVTWGVRCEPFAVIDLNSTLAARVKVYDKSGNQLGFISRLHVPTMTALTPSDWNGNYALVSVGRIEVQLPQQAV